MGHTGRMLWHLHPLTFLDAEPLALPADAPVVHRLPALVPWLDHVADLGLDALLLGPVFASSTHGYDTVDHRQVDRRLGDEADLAELVARAGERGIGVVLDGVFNHVGRDHFAFRDVLEHGDASAYRSWFVPDGSPGGWRCFEGHQHLVELNHDEPAVADHVSQVMAHWLDRGVAGWRLDAAYAVPIPFWRKVSDRVRAEHPRAWLLGEVIHGDYAAFVTDGGLDTVTQYELWKSIWSSLNEGNFFELEWTLRRHTELLAVMSPQTFVGNHDVTRIASRLTDDRLLPHAIAVLMTVGGTPSVYAGDEVGMTGVKEDRTGGDDAVRPAFPASGLDLPGAGGPVHELYRALIRFRAARPWLARAVSTVHTLTNTTLCYSSTGEGRQVATALSSGPAPVTLPAPDGAWSVVAGPGALVDGGITLPARGWALLAEDG